MPDPKARVRIVGENELGAAFNGALRDAQGFSRKLSGTFKAAFAIAGAVGIGAIVRATADAERAFAQLEAGVKSTGGAAGFTAPQLAEMSTALQSTTTYADDAIQGMQGVLLTFTRIRGPEFKAAQQAILDMSTRLGKDLTSSATQVGKALNDPIKGVSALGEAGVQFSDDQKAMIKSLVETGKTAEAQRVILKELETQFGGSAAAARDTFGGALEGLKNAFGDLLEMKSGVSGLADEINKLSDLLSSDEVKQSADDFGGTMVMAFSAILAVLRPAAEKAAEFIRLMGDVGSVIDHRLFGRPLDDSAAKRFADLYDEEGDRGLGPTSRGGQRRPSGPTPEDIAAAKAAAEAEEKARKEAEKRAAAYREIIAAAKYEAYLLATYPEATPLPGATDAANDKAIKDYFDGVIDKGIEMKDDFIQLTDEMTVFAEQAARNLQTAFADFLFDPFKDGLDGMLKGFVDTLRRMVAEAAASQILGFIGSMFPQGSFFGSLFGAGNSVPARASGGSVNAGSVYQVNEREPEFFKPGQGGEVIPLGKMSGLGQRPVNINFSPVYNTDARGASVELVKALPALFAENNRQLMAALRDQIRRGAFAHG